MSHLLSLVSVFKLQVQIYCFYNRARQIERLVSGVEPTCGNILWNNDKKSSIFSFFVVSAIVLKSLPSLDLYTSVVWVVFLLQFSKQLVRQLITIRGTYETGRSCHFNNRQRKLNLKRHCLRQGKIHRPPVCCKSDRRLWPIDFAKDLTGKM